MNDSPFLCFRQSGIKNHQSEMPMAVSIITYVQLVRILGALRAA